MTDEWGDYEHMGIPGPSYRRGRREELTLEEKRKIKAWLRKNKVTKLPGYGDPEFAKLHIERMREFEEAPVSKKAAMLAKGLIP